MKSKYSRAMVASWVWRIWVSGSGMQPHHNVREHHAMILVAYRYWQDITESQNDILV